MGGMKSKHQRTLELIFAVVRVPKNVHQTSFSSTTFTAAAC